MTVSMYSISIPVFIQHLNGLNTVLDKAASWAAARKVNEAAPVMSAFSGKANISQCPLFTRKRTFVTVIGMSALCH